MWDRSPSPIPVHRQEGQEQSREGLGPQETCTPDPGDVLWEHDSTLHWVLVINAAGHQGHWNTVRGWGSSHLWKTGKHHCPTKTQNRDSSLKHLPCVGGVPDKWGLGTAHSAGEQADGGFPSSPSAQRSALSGVPETPSPSLDTGLLGGKENERVP